MNARMEANPEMGRDLERAVEIDPALGLPHGGTASPSRERTQLEPTAEGDADPAPRRHTAAAEDRAGDVEIDAGAGRSGVVTLAKPVAGARFEPSRARRPSEREAEQRIEVRQRRPPDPGLGA